MGLPRPKYWPDYSQSQKNTIWTEECDPRMPLEIETGQLVVNKKTAWQGLVMTAFMGRHHHYFLKNLLTGDKQVSFIVLFV